MYDAVFEASTGVSPDSAQRPLGFRLVLGSKDFGSGCSQPAAQLRGRGAWVFR